MHAYRESGTNFVLVYAMFEPDHVFDARGQNPVCQELQIRLKKGLKMASEVISEHQI